jgi:hypothetical protein
MDYYWLELIVLGVLSAMFFILGVTDFTVTAPDPDTWTRQIIWLVAAFPLCLCEGWMFMSDPDPTGAGMIPGLAFFALGIMSFVLLIAAGINSYRMIMRENERKRWTIGEEEEEWE